MNNLIRMFFVLLSTILLYSCSSSGNGTQTVPGGGSTPVISIPDASKQLSIAFGSINTAKIDLTPLIEPVLA